MRKFLCVLSFLMILPTVGFASSSDDPKPLTQKDIVEILKGNRHLKPDERAIPSHEEIAKILKGEYHDKSGKKVKITMEDIKRILKGEMPMNK